MTLYHTQSISQMWLNELEGIFLFGIPALLNPACPRPCCVVTTGHTEAGYVLGSEVKNALAGWAT